jgi:hypothetical protein
MEVIWTVWDVKIVELWGTKKGISEKQLMSLKHIEWGLYRAKNKFKKDYQSRPNLVKDKNGNLLADSLQYSE